MDAVIDQVVTDRYAIYHADCVELLRGMPDNSVDYIIYSPPFASLYTYSASDRDMGNVRDLAEFYAQYAFISRELARVLKPGRLLSFHCMNLPTTKVRNGYIGLADFRGDLIRHHQGDGMIYHSEVCIWKDPVTAMQRTKAIGLLHKQLKKDAALSRQGIPDYLVTMRKPGANPDPVTNTNESFPVDRWQEWASPVWSDWDADSPAPEWAKYLEPVWHDINPSDTLQGRSAREHEDEKHIAPLQLEVIRRAVGLWTNAGDTVLSPFAGIGSEGYVSVLMGRRFVGAELKASYYRQACANLARAVAESQRATLPGFASLLAAGGS
jgi:DNA modification methylase